jgi:hypothetical protein
MPHEDAVFDVQLAPDLDDILGIPLKACVFGPIVSADIGPAVPDMIEQDGAETVAKTRLHEAPHVLVAPKAMGKHHCSIARTVNLDVVAFEN